jgi:hypothetical protein
MIDVGHEVPLHLRRMLGDPAGVLQHHGLCDSGGRIVQYEGPATELPLPVTQRCDLTVVAAHPARADHRSPAALVLIEGWGETTQCLARLPSNESIVWHVQNPGRRGVYVHDTTLVIDDDHSLRQPLHDHFAADRPDRQES